MAKSFKLSLIFALLLLQLIYFFHMLQSAQAADFTVTTTADSGAGSLRAAIEAANLTPAADTITFASGLAGQTISLSSGELLINSALTIDAGTLTSPPRLSGNNSSRVFFIDGGAVVTLTHLIIADGATATGSGSCFTLCGGGIYVEFGAQLSLIESIITDNFANSGGGLFNSGGTLLIQDSQISNNQSAFDGGGIRSGGEAIIRNSRILSNTSQGVGGGGLYLEAVQDLQIISSTIAYNTTAGGGGALLFGPFFEKGLIQNSTLAYNTADNGGGAIIFDVGMFQTGSLQISNSTLSGNQAPSNGAALVASATFTSSLVVTITNSTLSGNSGGIFAASDASSSLTTTLRNTLLANSTGANCVNVSGDSSNLTDDNSCLGFSQGEARLAPLADNGGPTLTHLPLPGSAAMGAGNPTVCQAAPINGLDQRGEARDSAACDIGSTEVEDQRPLYLPLVLKN